MGTDTPSRSPWGNFPDVVRNGDLGELKAQPEYAAAKAGDFVAALDLADRIVRSEFVDMVSRLGRDHPKPVLLPVLAEESVGKNKIPSMFAEVLGDRLGWAVETNVLQVSRAFRTSSGADHRLAVHSEFGGSLNQDAGYILIDDTLTMGGTLADLRGFVMSRGGQVLGAAVGVAHQGAVHLPIRGKMLESIQTKHGPEAIHAFAQEQWGYGIECLTQGEAGHVRAAVSLDALRDRLSQARNAYGQRLGKARAAPSQIGKERPRSEEINPDPSGNRKAQRLGSGFLRPAPVAAPDALHTHPPPAMGTLPRDQTPFPTHSQEHTHMAAQIDHLFSYGPLDVLNMHEENSKGFHVVHADMDKTAFIPEADPLHKEVQKLIEKNPHSRGFAANQIYSKVEAHGLWNARELDAPGVSFGPSREVRQDVADPIQPTQVKRSILYSAEDHGFKLGENGLPAPKTPETAEVVKEASVAPKGPEKTNADVLQDWPTADSALPIKPSAPETEKNRDRPSFARQKPVPLLAHKNRPLVLDHGDHITVTRRAMLGIGRTAQEKRELAVGTALQAAVERFGQPVHFTGNPAFLKQTAEMAVNMGIKLEPGDKLAAEIYQKALKEQEQSRAPRGNVLGPARQQPQKQQDQDMER